MARHGHDHGHAHHDADHRHAHPGGHLHAPKGSRAEQRILWVALLTGAFMHVFTAWLAVPYLPAQVATTGIVLFWSFIAHKLWTFREPPALVP